MQKTVLSTIGAMLIPHQVCAEPLALDPVEIAVGPEPQAASAAPRWDALNSEIVVKRDSTGVKSISHEGLTGHHGCTTTPLISVTMPLICCFAHGALAR